MPPGSRSYHNKSRNGCRQCKTRRVKCDLQAPVCSHCRRRKEHCDFLDLLAAKANTEDKTSFNEVSTHQPERTPPQDPISQPESLMFHYINETAMTLPLLEDAAPFWQHILPRLALRYDFMQQGLLSISALHLSHSRTVHRANYFALGRTHYLDATNAFRASLSDLDQENSLAVFGFAVVVAMFHFNASLQTECSSMESTLEILEPLLALRSASKLVHGGLKDYLKAYEHQNSLVRAAAHVGISDHGMIQQIDNIEVEISNNDSDLKQYQQSVQALGLLREAYEQFGTTPRSWFHLAWWPCNLSRDYVDLLLAKEPVALAVFEAWCCYVRNAPSRWFWHGWADRALAVIEKS